MDIVSEHPMDSFPINMREGVIWAYRLLLGRDPNDEQAIATHLGHTPSSLRRAFLESAEYNSFGAKRPNSGLSASHDAVVAAFRPFCATPAPAGSWHDFLGARTQCDYLPDAYKALSGAVRGPPGSANGPMHDVEEWVGTLRSVLEAGDQLVVVELGAGWAPWLVGSAKAAERRGIRDVRLVGVEGSLGHVGFMRRHFLDNGIDPQSHRLIHGVVGAVDGTAYFPRLAQPNNVYGSEATYAADANSLEMEAVPSLSLQTLLRDLPIVNLLHCDIQGMEAEVFRAGRDIVNQRVHRVVIGTHSRRVEVELMELFSGLGWILEDETVCKLIQAADGRLLLTADGTQVWRNPKA